MYLSRWFIAWVLKFLTFSFLHFLKKTCIGSKINTYYRQICTQCTLNKNNWLCILIPKYVQPGLHKCLIHPPRFNSGSSKQTASCLQIVCFEFWRMNQGESGFIQIGQMLGVLRVGATQWEWGIDEHMKHEAYGLSVEEGKLWREKQTGQKAREWRRRTQIVQRR